MKIIKTLLLLSGFFLLSAEANSQNILNGNFEDLTSFPISGAEASQITNMINSNGHFYAEGDGLISIMDGSQGYEYSNIAGQACPGQTPTGTNGIWSFGFGKGAAGILEMDASLIPGEHYQVKFDVYNSQTCDPSLSPSISFGYSNSSTSYGSTSVTSTSFIPATNWYTSNICEFTVPIGASTDNFFLTFQLTDQNDDRTFLYIDNVTISKKSALAVTFGTINATFKSDVLKIDWSTLHEEDNVAFDVELSKDGNVFTPVAHILSKADNGVSATPLMYSYIHHTASLLSFSWIAMLYFAALIIVFFSSKIKRYLIGMLLVLFITACTKTNVVDTAEKGNLYVRIALLSKDGTKSYSKIIKAVK
jgi:hypothetical protein